MKQIETFVDERMSIDCCVYCGGPAETRDHVPSRVLLDIEEPDICPENLPVVPACYSCNSSFSKDEEYLACLIEIARFGTTDRRQLRRSKVKKILDNKPALESRIEQGLYEQYCLFGKQEADIQVSFEYDRVQRVALKLARGHVAYELSEIKLDEPSSFKCLRLDAMSDSLKREFGDCLPQNIVPELGSRGMVRAFTGQDLDRNGWVLVQPGRYRYVSLVGGSVAVRIVASEFLALEVVWDEEYQL